MTKHTPEPVSLRTLLPILGGLLMLPGASCSPTQPVARQRAQPRAKATAKPRTPPPRPPKQKLYGQCEPPQPLTPSQVEAGSPPAREGRLPKIRPIKKWQPATVDLTVLYGKSLSWYRITRGKIHLLERISTKLLSNASTQHWRNAKELVLAHGSQFVRMLFHSKPHAGRLEKKGGRYRLSKMKIPKGLLPGSYVSQKVIFTKRGEMWLDRCTKQGSDEDPGCQNNVHRRLLPTFKKAKKDEYAKARPEGWTLRRPKGYRMKIIEECLFCYKGRQPWVLHPEGAHNSRVGKSSSGAWIGHRVPLWVVYLPHRNRDNAWAGNEITTNLYEACRGMPVSFSAKLFWGPRPYFAYRKNTHVKASSELLFRYDGQLFAKLVVPVGAEIAFRPNQ